MPTRRVVRGEGVVRDPARAPPGIDTAPPPDREVVPHGEVAERGPVPVGIGGVVAVVVVDALAA